MATQKAPSHKRADSVLDGTEVAHDALATAQAFCKGVALLASDPGFKLMSELAESVPQREVEGKVKDKTIQGLRDELAALRNERDVYNKKQLSNFEHRYEDWKEENTRLKAEMDEMEANLDDKDSEMATLQEHFDNLKVRVEDLEKENAQITSKVKDRGQQIGTLEAKLQRAHADLDGRAKEIEEARIRVATLQGSLDNEANQHRVLREEANKTRIRYNNFVQFSVKISELDLKDFTNRMEQLWTNGTALVENFFGRNMPESVLKNDWTGLKDNDIFKHPIPLPQSNTDVAKRMRAAVILGTLTRLIDRLVFQPTYLLDEQSGLRESLIYEATNDPTKERYVRGILLSMSPEAQEANSERIIQDVTDQLLDVVNVRALLTPETFATFPDALTAFVRQCLELWKTVQRGKQKLEPHFEYLASTRFPWHLYGDRSAETTNGRQAAGSPTTTAIENSIVLIPRIYIIVPNADPDPITPGCVLSRSHIDAAAEELRQSLPSAPFSQASSRGHRGRPGRNPSISGGVRSFLA